MPDPPPDFFSELRRRKVFRAALLYLVVALAVIEGADIVFASLLLPEWTVRLVVVLALLGFPITLVAAWWLEVTPDGIRRTPSRDGSVTRAGMAVTVVAVTLLAGWVAWARWLGPGASASAVGSAPAAATAEAAVGPPLTRVAVLYFDDHSPGGDLEYLAAGLTEELIHQLSQVPALDVVSRNGVKPFRERPAPLDTIVATLQAGTLVEGSVQRSGDVMRVTVQLIDGASGIHLLSRTVERPWGELFALQDALAETVVITLRRRLGQAVKLAAERRSTSSVAAWEAFQRAERAEERLMAAVADGDTTRVDRVLAEVDSLFARAQTLDPAWSTPPVHRGWAWARTAVQPDAEYTHRSRATLEARAAVAFEHAERALALEPGHAGALELRGFLHMVRWHHGIAPDAATRSRAESDLRAAVEREPDRARAWRLLSSLAMKTGDFRNGRQYAELALAADSYLDDAEDIYGLLYETALNLEDVDEASRWCDEGHRRFPESTLLSACGLYTLASLPADSSHIPLAWARLQDYAGVDEGPGWNRAAGLSLVAATLARAGMPDSARAVMARARRNLPPDEPIAPYFDYFDAYVAVQLGDSARALDRLRTFLAAYPSQREFLPRDWWFRPLWDDPGFQALMSAAP